MKIIVDCDEVILDTTIALKNFYLETINPHAKIDGTMYSSQWEIWNDMQEWKLFMNNFTHSEAYCDIPPVKGAVDAVKELKNAGHSLIIVTSCGVEDKIQENRRENIKKLFGDNTFDEIIFLSLGWGNKKDAFAQTRADMLIDDNPDNCRDALSLGIQPVLLRHPTNNHQIENIRNGEIIVTKTPEGKTEKVFDDLKNEAIIADSWNDALNKISCIV